MRGAGIDARNWCGKFRLLHIGPAGRWCSQALNVAQDVLLAVASTPIDFDEFVSRKHAKVGMFCPLLPRLTWYHTCEQWGDDQAEIYFREIQRAIELVANDPLIG